MKPSCWKQRSGYLFKDEILSYAQAELYTGQETKSALLYQFVKERYGFDPENDPVTHYYLDVLGEDSFVDEAISLGNTLMATAPNNRWLLTSQASLLATSGDTDRAIMLYQRILDLPNQQDDWLHNAFNCWTWLPLSALLLEKDQTLAEHYLNEIINSSQGCGNRQEAGSMLDQLN